MWAMAMACLALGVSGTSYASGAEALEVGMQARCQDLGYSYVYYEFKVRFESEDLPEGSVVDLIYSYSGQEFSGENAGEARLEWVESGQDGRNGRATRAAQGELTLGYMMVGGKYYSHMDFVIRATLPSGDVLWHRGGQDRSFYQSYFFHPQKLPCYKMIDFTPLQITVANLEEEQRR